MDELTIRQLLTMSSGLKHTFGLAPWHELVLSTYTPNVRKAALDVSVVEPPDTHFNYSNYHTQLLGMILERTTGVTVSEYLESRIWVPCGMQYPASWSVDESDPGFEIMAAGINARAIDYAKLGRLYLQEGRWGGEQMVPAEWVRRTTNPVPELERTPGYYERDSSAERFEKGLFYSHHWWPEVLRQVAEAAAEM